MDTGSRQKLIEATIDLMSDRGFEPMGIHSILEAADVSKSNFYYHFKSKEELCLAALESMCEQFFSEFLDPILQDSSRSPRARLERLFDTVYNKLESGSCQTGCPFVNLAAETSDFVPSFREKIDLFFTRYRKKLADCYREGVKCGEFKSSVKPDMAGLTLLAAINGIAVLTKVQKKPVVVKQIARTMLSLFEALDA